MRIDKLMKILRKEFKDNLFEYVRIKKMINGGFSLDEERVFKEELNTEMLRVFTFINNEHISLLSKVEGVNIQDDEVCETLKDEIFEFIEFIKGNLHGMKVVLQHHDKVTGFLIARDYRRKLREKKQEIKSLKSLLSSLSRTNERTERGILGEKYWIPPESLVSLKLGILKHLSRAKYVDDAKKLDDSCVNTVYLDNADFGLYRAFLRREKEAFLVKLRWVGPKPVDVFVEVAKGGEERHEITVPERCVVDLLNGKEIWQEICSRNNVKKDYEELREIISNNRLRPILRTFFRRCTFEDPEGGEMKINVDSNIVMIKEASEEELVVDSRPLQYWVKSDALHDWPFRKMGLGEIIRFPYSIVEIVGVKSKESVSWVEELLAQSRIEKVNGFSKFLHGCALIYPEATIEHPQWLPQAMRAEGSGEVAYRNSYSPLNYIQGESETSYDQSQSLVSEDRTRIAIPVRVEPKAFFANERTFLSWVQFAIFLGGIGTAMVGLGDVHAYMCGVMLVGISAIFAFYALYLFHSRAMRIRAKDPGPYEDIVGPLILVSLFILVMILSFIFRFPIKKNGLVKYN
ncbi:vacuolar transporter chaperone [Glugoides intestinalis]